MHRFRITLRLPAFVAAAGIVSLCIAEATFAARAQPVETRELHRVLVIPVNLPNRFRVPFDRKEIALALFGAKNSVASRYRVISYGHVQFIGSERDVLDPITLAEPPDFCGTGVGRLAEQAERAESRLGISLQTYQHVVFVIPKDAPCWWTGLGDIGGKRVWVKATTAKALQHELGHNLGMDHAVNWKGAEAEASDFMGSGNTSLNAPHVIEMGWLRDHANKVITIAADADVTLETLESDPRRSALPKVAILRPSPGANTYYLSYRASAPDNPLPDAFTDGASIHIADGSHRTGRLTYYVTSLNDGGTYRDGPLVIAQLSHTKGERVTIRIRFSGNDVAMPEGPPPAPAGTIQSRASGKCLDLPRGETADGTIPIQFDCRGGTNQQWAFEPVRDYGYRIVSGLSGKCIGVDPQSAEAGSHIVQSRCSGSPGETWAFDHAIGGYVLVNVASGLCLDVPGASTSNGAEPIVWSCHGGANQIWRFEMPRLP